MSRGNRRSTLYCLLAWVVMACGGSGTMGQQDQAPKQGTAPSSDTVVAPGKSIGEVVLGASADELPEGAKLEDEIGEYRGVRFSMTDGRVADVWIEDIRVHPAVLRFAGLEVPAKASLDELKQLFGGCEPVEGVKGGMFFNCKSGVALGCSYDGSDQFVQLRVKHR